MEQSEKLVFGYGSLMNDDSRLRSAPHSVVLDRQAVLNGYQRIFNVAYGEHVYANIHPQPDMQVVGTVMQVTPEGFQELCERECYYSVVDISQNLEGDWKQNVYAFIGTDNTQGSETIKQSYVDLCLSGVDPMERERWVGETIMNFHINKTA